MKWMRLSTRFRNTWSGWYPVWAWWPHECRWCIYTFWWVVMDKRIQLISNYAGSMWISEHQCIECADKGRVL